MRRFFALIKRKPGEAAVARVELFARGEGFRVTRGLDVYEGVCFLDYYRDEWSRLTLIADSIRAVAPSDAPPLTEEQQQAIAAEAQHALQMKAKDMQVCVVRNAA